MPNDKISMRQLLVLLFAALLSPAIQTLPAWTAEAAGEAGWLSTIAALPVLLVLCWMLFTLFRALPEGTGLADAFELVLGRVTGKLITAAYLLWGVLLLAVNTRRYALRFLSTSYRNASLGLFVVLLLAAVLWISRGKLGALARAGEIFYLALSLVLGLTIIFALLKVEMKHVFPIWTQDVPNVLRAVLPALSILGYVIFAAFLAGGVKREEGSRRRSFKWAVAICGVLTAMQFACLGNFGPDLTARLDVPFFIMVKGIGVRGAFERVESVVIALWVLSDLSLLGLVAFSCRTMAKTLFGLRQDKVAALPIVLLALAGALFLFPDSFALSAFIASVVAPGNLIFGFAVPTAVFLVGKLKGQV